MSISKPITSPLSVLSAVSITGLAQAAGDVINGPDDIDGLIAWYDATDTATITLSGSDATEISDKSGVSNPLVFPSGSRPQSGTRTVNGDNVLDFNNDHGVFPSSLLDTFTDDFTLVVVAGKDNTSNTRLLHGLVGGSIQFGINTQNGNTRINYTLGSGTTIDETIDTNTHIYSMRHVSSTQSFEYYFDSIKETVTRPSIATLDSFEIGRNTGSNNQKWNGYVKEFILYDRALTDAELGALGI